MNMLTIIENENIQKLITDKTIPIFRAGDTVTVSITVKEGTRERKQAFEGVVIARRNRGIGSTFKVRKISNGEGVERLFHLYSPKINIKVVKHGKVRRAKLYYLRERIGKAARIAEKRRIILE